MNYSGRIAGMSKVSFVSGSLHRISGQISEAAGRIRNPQQPDAPEESFSENFPQNTAPAPRPAPNVSAPAVPPSDSAERNIYLKPRYEELLRMKRDLVGQLYEAEARFSAEHSRFETLAAERNGTLVELRAILSRLESCRIPELADADFKTALNEALRTFENGRIELIRATVAEAGANTAPSLASSAKMDLSSLTAGELMKKGFAFFFPLILTILLASLFLGVAFVVAWKVAL